MEQTKSFLIFFFFKKKKKILPHVLEISKVFTVVILGIREEHQKLSIEI